MAPLPKGMKFEPTPLPGEFVPDDPLLPQESTPEAKASAKSTRERVVEYLKSRPAAIADTAKSLVTEGGGVDQAFASKYLMGLPAVAEAAIDTAPAAGRALMGGPSISDDWRRNLAKRQKPYDDAEQKHPGVALTGALLAPNLAGKATAGQRVTSAAAQSGIDAATHGEDPALAGGAATALATAAEGTSALGKYLGLGLRNVAGRSAVNAAGLRGGIVNQAKRAGIPTLDALGREEIPKLGNQMLDAGLVPFAGSKEAILQRSNKMMDEAGNAAASLRTRGDLAGRFSQAEGIAAAEGRLAQRVDPTKGGNLQTARAAGRAQDFIQDAAKTPDTFEAADALKRGAYGNTNWSTEAPDASKLKRATVSGYRQSMEDQLDRLLPGEGKALREANQRYGLAAKTADFAEEAAGRESANRKMGSMEIMAAMGVGGAGLASGSAGLTATGALIPVATHLARTRGAATVAPLARLGSKAANAAGGAVNQSPQASAVGGSALARYLNKDDEDDVSWFTGR